MAIVVRFAVSGMSKTKYEEVHRRLEAAGFGAPPGRLYHVGYGPDDAIQVIDVWESPEALDAFGQRLVPILQEMGIAATPQVDPAVLIVAG